MYNGDQVKVVCGLQLTHRIDVCHSWHGVDGSTPQLRLVGTLNRRMATGSLLKPSGTDFMQRTWEVRRKHISVLINKICVYFINLLSLLGYTFKILDKYFNLLFLISCVIFESVKHKS